MVRRSQAPFSALLTDVDMCSDFGFVRVGDKCELVGLEPVPPGVCTEGKADATYEGSSGYRKISGDTCIGGIEKDTPVQRKCTQGEWTGVHSMCLVLTWCAMEAQPPPGEVAHVQVRSFACRVGYVLKLLNSF